MKKGRLDIILSAFFLTLVLNQNIKAMQKYNKLTVVEINSVFKYGKTRRLATCICDCGKTVYSAIEKLKSGQTKSCGCYRLAIATKHGLSKHPLKGVYNAMIYRCDPNHADNPKFRNYAGRSISVCHEWKDSFLTFYIWCIENGWKKGLTLDRIDNDGNYGPGNCRFATRIVQNINRRRTKWIQYNGERRLVKEVCIQLGVNYRSILCRIGKGVPDHEVFNVRTNKKRFTDDEVKEMASIRSTGMPYYKIAALFNTQKSSVMYSLKQRKLTS